MSGIFFTLIFIIVCALEWALSPFSIGGANPPLVVSFLFIAFLRFSFGTGAWIAVVAGFILETVTILPFGTLAVALFAEAAMASLLRSVFSNMRASFVQAVSLGIMIISFYFIILALEILFGGSVFITRNTAFLFAGGIAWAFIASIGFFVLRVLSWKFGFSRSPKFI